MVSNSSTPKEKKVQSKKVLVPRKKLQSVPDLLANGANDESSEAESIYFKVAWMAFLLIMFYVSFEIFLKVAEKRQEGGSIDGMRENAEF